MCFFFITIFKYKIYLIDTELISNSPKKRKYTHSQEDTGKILIIVNNDLKFYIKYFIIEIYKNSMFCYVINFFFIFLFLIDILLFIDKLKI